MSRLTGLCFVVLGVLVGLPSAAPGRQATEKEIAGLAEKLGDKEKARRDAAAKKLSELLTSKDKDEQERARAGLVQAMKKHRDAEVRSGAEDLLMKRYRERIVALIDMCGDEAFDVREAARRELVEIGTPALKLLKEAAKKNPDLVTRGQTRRAAEAIEYAGR